MKKLVSALLAGTLSLGLAATALAATSVNGQVVSTKTEIVVSDLGGTAADISVAVGDTVLAGDTLLTLKTTKVYALQAGTVHFFGQVGDQADTVAERYGAVAYLEPTRRYTITASTKNSYDAEENRIIHPGEVVYLRAVENNQHTGTGQVTAVTDSSFTVEVTSGTMQSGETVNIFRTADFANTSRIGRDSVTLSAPVAYTGEGVIVAYAVADGAKVQKGDVLFETLSGSYSPEAVDLTTVAAPADGVISSVSVSKGGTVTAGGEVAQLYLDEGLRIEATVYESDLSAFQVGTVVTVEFSYVEDGQYSITGVIEKVSRIGSESADSDSEETAYTVWVKPDTTEGLSYGLHALISATGETVEAAAPAVVAEPVEDVVTEEAAE